MASLGSASVPTELRRAVDSTPSAEPRRHRHWGSTSPPLPQRHSRLSRCKLHWRCSRLLPGDDSSSAQRWSPSSLEVPRPVYGPREVPPLPPRSQAQPAPLEAKPQRANLGFPGGGRCETWRPVPPPSPLRPPPRPARGVRPAPGGGSGSGRRGQPWTPPHTPLPGHLARTALAQPHQAATPTKRGLQLWHRSLLPQRARSRLPLWRSRPPTRWPLRRRGRPRRSRPKR